jgi:magnesium-transporting ATPase (P-type)
MADILQVNTELPADFTPTAPSGLTDEEAASRKPNISHHRPDKSTAQILAENLFTPFNGLNVALAVCLALVGSWRNMLFLGVVVSNTLIGTVQELRARKTIRKLSLLNAPTAHALRNGQEKTCAPDALVKGDLVILRAGDQVMADAVVTSGQGAANESLLTGESTPMRKQPGDFLLSGSYILEGTFTAQLVYVGDESYAARLTRSAKEIRRPKSVLMTEVNRLIRIVSAALIPIGLLLFCKQFFLQHLPLTTAVPTSVAAMIGMIPEGLILLISVALAVGVIKLGKRNTLVQELYGIETLSRADVLCLDKTGTITTGKMTLDSLLPLSGDEGAMRTQLGRFLSSMDERSGTLDALRAEIPDVQGEKPVAVLPFSSERKKSAVSFADGTTLILGAPTFVLDDAHLAPIRKTLSDCAGRGLRVLVLAEADGCVTETDAPAVTHVIGLCLLTDEIRPAAQETLHYFHTQGVALKIISGDDEKTVAAIARKVGLSGGAVDASTLADNELPDACERYAVFGRVTPTRKKALVEALKAKGHHVAMTGDGVNDAPSIKSADIGIGMGITGTDVTKNVADMVLTDDNFATIVNAVEEGRRIYDNIRKAIQFLLGSNLAEVLAIFTATLLGFTILEAPHLLFINLVTDCFPALALGLEKAESDIMRRRPRDPSDGIFAGGLGFDVLYQGLLVTALTLAAFFIGERFETGHWAFMNIAQCEQGMTMAFLTMSMCEIFHSFNMRSQRGSVIKMSLRGSHNMPLFGAMVASLVLTTAVIEIPFLANAFGFTPIGFAEYATSLALAFSIIPIVEIIKVVQRAAAKRKVSR